MVVWWILELDNCPDPVIIFIFAFSYLLISFNFRPLVLSYLLLLLSLVRYHTMFLLIEQ